MACLGGCMNKKRRQKRYLAQPPVVAIAAMDGMFETTRKGMTLTRLTNGCGRRSASTYKIDRESGRFYRIASKISDRNNNCRLNDIEEVTTGEEDDINKGFSRRSEKNIFVVYFNNGASPWVLAAPDAAQRDIWVKTLRSSKNYDETQQFEQDAVSEFYLGDRNGDGYIDFDEMLKLFHNMNLFVNKTLSRKLFQKACFESNTIRNKQVMSKEEFLKFFRQLERRKDLEEIFTTYSGGKAYLSHEAILKFLRIGLKNKYANQKDVRNILSQTVHVDKYRDSMNYDAFLEFMLSDNNYIYNFSHRRCIYQDMTQPITKYYINCSSMKFGTTTTIDADMYASVLSAGCRFVRVECTDGKSGPVIKTNIITKSVVPVQDVIKRINQFAFRLSPYPLFLYIKSTCGKVNRRLLATYLETLLKGKLWEHDQAMGRKVFSPEDLKYKILVTSELSGNNDPLDKMTTVPVFSRDEVAAKEKHPAMYMFCVVESKEKKQLSLDIVRKGSRESLPHSLYKDNNRQSQTVKSGHKKSLLKIPVEDVPYLSMVETHDGVECWNAGVQLVALRQTQDDNREVNHGKFIDNGGAGYVLKPPIELVKQHHDHVQDLEIEIISAQRLPKPVGDEKGEVIDPYVTVEIRGEPDDTTSEKTTVIDNNGFNPVWYEKFKFKIKYPELAFVIFRVFDHDMFTANDFIGYYSVPLYSMLPGYRHMPLFDTFGNKIKKALLFVQVKLPKMGRNQQNRQISMANFIRKTFSPVSSGRSFKVTNPKPKTDIAVKWSRSSSDERISPKKIYSDESFKSL